MVATQGGNSRVGERESSPGRDIKRNERLSAYIIPSRVTRIIIRERSAPHKFSPGVKRVREP